MAFPTPTAGQYNSPSFQAFLGQHPTLAGLTSAKAVNQFLAAHPPIAAAYTRLLTPKAPALTATAPTPVAPPTATTAAATDSAAGMVDGWLASRGLTGIGEAAWSRYLDLGGESNPNAEAVIYQELRSGAAWTKGAYAARYPGMAELDKQGRGMTEAEYRTLEDAYRDRAHRYGLPESFYDDPTDFGKLIAGNVAPDEYEERLQIAARYSATDPNAAKLRDEYARLYGPQLGQGAATAYMIDPTKALDVIERQHRAATAAAASSTTGFGSLSKQQAELVGGLGVTEDQARSTFGQLGQVKALETSLIGDAGSDAIDADTLIAAGFQGNADAQRRIEREQSRRRAQFQGGGGYAASQGGVSGLGSASS